MSVSKLHHRIPLFGQLYLQRNEARDQRDQAIRKRDEARDQRDQALRERDEARRAGDQAAGFVTFRDRHVTKRPAAGEAPPTAPRLVSEAVPAFDRDRYLAFYPDVAAAGNRCIRALFGAWKGRGSLCDADCSGRGYRLRPRLVPRCSPGHSGRRTGPVPTLAGSWDGRGPLFQRAPLFSPSQLVVLSGVLNEEVDPGMLMRVLKNAKGTCKKECPICGYSGLFRAFGNPPRWDARCPSCSSLERHRLLALVLQRVPSIITDGAAVLHFAPEICVRTLLQRSNIHYTSADLTQADADLKLNIEDINLNDEQFDVIVCNHVLEHVNDKKALSELYRILRSSGVLIIMVPIKEGCDTTYEDDSIKDDKERLVHFGQEDHVRVYGADFITRLTNAGFQVTTYTAFGKDAVKFGLFMGEKIFLCHKR